jgi:hypothetical protein
MRLDIQQLIKRSAFKQEFKECNAILIKYCAEASL